MGVDTGFAVNVVNNIIIFFSLTDENICHIQQLYIKIWLVVYNPVNES